MKSRPSTRFAFWLAFGAIIIGPAWFPRFPLFYFVPYIVLCLYQYSRYASLWRALLCGVIVDILSSNPFLGFCSLNYCLVTLVLYGQRRNFFEDKLSTLPIMTFLFSILSTLLAFLFRRFSGNSLPISLQWIATDLLIMPLLDSFYALLVFSLPFQLRYRLRQLRLFKKT